MGKNHVKSIRGFRRLLSVAVASALTLSFAGPAAATYEAGREAYKRGQFEEAIDIWKRFAVAGDVRSKKILGDVYFGVVLETNEGVPDPAKEIPADKIRALLWYTLAAYHHFPKSYQQPTAEEVNARILAEQRLIDVRFQMSSSDVKKAEDLVAQTFESGSAYDLYRLGLMYQRGAGVGKDNVKALKMFILAKDRGVGEASERYEFLEPLMSSSEVDRAKEAALDWQPPLPPEFSGKPRQQVQLEKLKEELEALKLEDAKEAVSDIDVELIQRALNALGFRPGPIDNKMGPSTRAAIKRFQYSTVARKRDLSEAEKFAVQTGVLTPEQTAKLFAEAADSGHPMSQYVYGVMHVRGIGVQQDGRKAVDWLSRAANANLVIANYALGVIYRDGTTGLNEVAPDRILARRYFARADAIADGGYPPAVEALEKLDLEAPRDNQ
ncbi:MAG: peptidoglycan-binding protein [Parvularculaceae bacterium]